MRPGSDSRWSEPGSVPVHGNGRSNAKAGCPAAAPTAASHRGTLVAVGQVMAPTVRADGAVRADFAGFVHPDHRGRGIGTELLGRLQRRAGEVAAQRYPGITVVRRTHAGASV